MVFDPEKFEAVHFSRKRQFANPEIQLPPSPFQTDVLEPRVVKPVAKNRSMRWLGVYFDPRLSFNDHAEKMASKGRRAAAGLIVLANKVQRVDTKTMHRAVHAYILPILTYAVSAWWPGRTRTNKNGKTIWNRVDGHLKKLDKAQNVALRAILPVWKTTPIKIMQKEAATPPIEHTLNYLFELASLRLHKLEPRHPIRLITKNAHSTTDPIQLERIARTCSPITQYSDPLVDSDPWEEHLFGGTQNVFQSTRGTRDKKNASQNFKSWIETLDRKDILLELRTNHSISLRASNTYHVAFPFHSGDRAPHFQYSCVASNVLRVLTSSAPSIKRHIYSFMYLSHLAPTFMFCAQSCSEHRAPRATLL